MSLAAALNGIRLYAPEFAQERIDVWYVSTFIARRSLWDFT